MYLFHSNCERAGRVEDVLHLWSFTHKRFDATCDFPVVKYEYLTISTIREIDSRSFFIEWHCYYRSDERVLTGIEFCFFLADRVSAYRASFRKLNK